MKLLLVLLSFFYSCFFHFLFVVVDALPCASVDCAALGNISFPFGAAPHCGASSSFLLSNCSTSQAYWYAFNEALIPDGADSFRPPAVMGIDNEGHNFINLTWDATSSQEGPGCRPPAPYSERSNYLPDSINLTDFANSSFQFSDYNSFLLFNCSNTSSLSDFKSTVEEKTQVCQSYHSVCDPDSQFNTTNCFQLKPSKELMLPHVMESLACTHFQFFVTLNNTTLAVKDWRAGEVQLYWYEMEAPSLLACNKCESTNGTCGYDDHSNFQCFCPGNQNSSTYCGVVHCNGLLSCSIGGYELAIGIAVSGVAIAKLAVLALCCLRRRRKSKRRTFDAGSSFRKRFYSQKSFGDNSSNRLDFNGLFERPTEFSYNSLASATASFSTILGEGGFGVVYKGTLEDSGLMAAVKVLDANRRHTSRQFLNEVATIGNIHHVNVVRLVGFCVEKSRKILVYEFVVNGSLDRWLFKGGWGELQMGGKNIQVQLDWKQRYAIAVGIARGLCYLHEECRHRIVHCDIKPQNILLDEQMRPKIADFGLAKLMTGGESQVLTLAKGTPGYVAPEFWTGGESQLSTKFDVYSYGMVLLELVSGRRNFVDHCFPAVAFDAAMEGDFKSILDENITKPMDQLTTIEWEQVRTAVFSALWCIQDHPARRPCMSEVVQYLEGVAPIPEHPLRPAVASTATNPSLPSSNHSHTFHNPIALSGGR